MDELNSLVWDIWSNFSSITDPIDRAPFIYPKLDRGGLLCIGMNPSFSGSGRVFEPTKNGPFQRMSVSEFYSLNISRRFGDQWESEELAQQQKSYERVPYFKPIRDIEKNVATPLGLITQHIDLFQMRETSQSQMLSVLENTGSNKVGFPNLNQFGEEQYDFFKKMLARIDPKIILIVNAYASHIIFKKEAVDFEKGFDSKLGCHFIPINGRNVPVFGSGMLAGMRSLDIYNRQRLIWSLSRAIGLNNQIL